MHQGVKCRIHNGHTVSSEFIGVSWNARKGEWRMDICKNHKRFYSHHGPGEDGELAAAMAYNEKALELYGPGARLN